MQSNAKIAQANLSCINNLVSQFHKHVQSNLILELPRILEQRKDALLGSRVYPPFLDPISDGPVNPSGTSRLARQEVSPRN